MRLTLGLVALFAAFSTVAGQTIPSCAIDCITKADKGTCGGTDNVCLCNNSAFVTNTTLCISQTCSTADRANAEAASQGICKAVGVTLTSTPSATAPPSANSQSDALANGVNLIIPAGAAAIAALLAL